MRESLEEPISVLFYYNARHKHVQPYQLTWQNQDYKLGKVDFWHKTKRGLVLIHHFSMADIGGSMYFKIALNTDNLHWVLEEYMAADDMRVQYESWQGGA